MSTELELMDHLLIGKARKLAERVHAGQVDKAGRPYVEHLERVAETVQHPKSLGLAKAVAWLHDIVEDTEVGELDLMAAAMPAEVVAAVLAITHQPNEPRTDYYARVRANDLALAVKLADVADNANPERLAVLDEATRARLERKYALAREELSRG
jgi:(p)ppGpp synthase/HD superfamily hydrolase